MIGPSLKGSGKGNSRCEPSDYRPSALADSIAARFHLAPAPPIAEYHDFLVTLRHPVARIVSWFYFLHPQFPPEKRPHHIQGCDGYHALYRCYDSISALGEGRLGAAIVSDTESNTDHDSNHQQDPSLSCKALAKDMITGRKKCWQNYYNYEYTYGELVRDDFQEQQQPPSQSPPKNETSSSDHRHPQHKNNNNNNKKKTNVTIYAIRTEHLEVDWNVIDALLGGSGQPSEGVSAPRKNSWGNHAATAAAAATAAIPVAAHDKALSVRSARQRTCATCSVTKSNSTKNSFIGGQHRRQEGGRIAGRATANLSGRTQGGSKVQETIVDIPTYNTDCVFLDLLNISLYIVPKESFNK
eukprot:CAMPEP_0170986248 /NCGR_PEP_ID=MMETSP0736-20130129/5971_1 /TAXON_ID=186038 /ORGANISM="Fragilariopsis kerguelensis, Strain L26-C5" /LENGTH=354 /DNA_ID=CAMNT_0011410351 /DNA_START=836 /DNA_END=1901 /DNA_ORIENTATION=+